MKFKNTMKVDVERIGRIRDWLRDGGPLETPHGRIVEFDMGDWNRPRLASCGTVCCVGGTAEMLYCERTGGMTPDTEVGSRLGLDDTITQHLFFPRHQIDALGDGTPGIIAKRQAVARVLTHLMETNELDWSVG